MFPCYPGVSTRASRSCFCDSYSYSCANRFEGFQNRTRHINDPLLSLSPRLAACAANPSEAQKFTISYLASTALRSSGWDSIVQKETNNFRLSYPVMKPFNFEHLSNQSKRVPQLLLVTSAGIYCGDLAQLPKVRKNPHAPASLSLFRSQTKLFKLWRMLSTSCFCSVVIASLLWHCRTFGFCALKYSLQ
jgi:hypothetical protein